ncbi:hypothetical protein [Gracilibacillus lacisalsi]|uniref:hypothetical protein n=1 Tax=Gracilibacillus lacisalsi TaxID=393087 RepID=UPI00036F41D1|nr:hypothetical protein [Gracilibacillus lacisalsi]
MGKRLSMVFLTMILAIISLLLAAKNPTGPNTVSFDEPMGLLMSVGMLVVLFLPPLFLAFFNQLPLKIISAIYQGFIVLSFLVMIPIGFFIPSVSVILVAVLGTIISICSVIVTISAGRDKVEAVTN